MMQLTQIKMKESMKLLIYFLYPDKKALSAFTCSTNIFNFSLVPKAIFPFSPETFTSRLKERH